MSDRQDIPRFLPHGELNKCGCFIGTHLRKHFSLPISWATCKVRFSNLRLGLHLCLTVAFCLIATQTTTAQEKSPESIDTSELPDPPTYLVALLERTPVVWQLGQRDPKVAAERPTLAGETKYAVRYAYNCRKRWRYDERASKLIITIRYTRIEWIPTHRIWLRDPPAWKDFWSDRIVLHELDHLRISSDPRHGERFKQRLKDTADLELQIANGIQIDQNYINKVVDDHVKNVFRDHVDLIEIRYQELDRVTNHGRRPVPADSPLAGMLKHASRSTVDPPPET